MTTQLTCNQFTLLLLWTYHSSWNLCPSTTLLPRWMQMLYLENHFRTLYTVAWRLDKDVPKPQLLLYLSLGVLQIVKTLDKIVRFSNLYNTGIHLAHTTGWSFFLMKLLEFRLLYGSCFSNAYVERSVITQIWY